MQTSLIHDYKMGAIVDVETTGMSPKRGDEVVEIGIILFRYNALDHDGVEIVETYQGLREPTDPIPFGVIRVHGITDDMVRGKTLDYNKMESIFARANFVVAHNASFDKGFLEHLLPMSMDRPWKCSCFDIQWVKHGLKNRRLGTLRDYFGIDHGKAHSALPDCEVVLEALKRPRYLR
ncbi:MAG: exonuclease domain-containing protein, partial [Phycisphaerales bacterium]|nr:exonuclease domain-containing protein [Phycisphaerales bacterium]